MKKWIYNTLIVVFGLVFLVSAGFLAAYFIEGWQQQSRYAQLAAMKEDVTPRPAIPDVGQQEQSPTEPQLVEITDPETGEPVVMLPEFVELYMQNNHIVGWLTVPGTVIDYPVMQSPQEPDYYLHRNFDKQESKRGCLYIWPECDTLTPSDNVTIYGHHMRDGSMFGQLDKYRDPAFRAENPYIYFDTLRGLHTYEVMAVFLTTASVGQGLGYHSFVDAADEAAFDAFVADVHKLQLYDTGITAAYGDKLICLSTCEYSQTNGRLVVVAKRIA